MENPGGAPWDARVLLELARERMPYGRYKGRVLCDLPEPYLVWLRQKGFPTGRTGELLAALYEIRLNGLGRLLEPLKEKRP